MLVLMAIIGDEAKAGYDVVHGTATVDAISGASHFIACKSGNHAYVIKKMDNDYYKNLINEKIQ